MNNLAQSTNSQDNNLLSNEQLRIKIQDSFHPLLSLLNPDQQAQAVTCLLEELPVVEAPSIPAQTKPVLPGLKPKTYRAIKKSDLPFFEPMLAIAVNVFFTTSATALIVAKPAIVITLLSFIYRYFTKGISLNYEQALVLNLLKQFAHPGLSIDSIANMISDKKLLSNDDVQKVLDSLKHIRKTDGTTANLVQETDGLWSAIDL